MTMKVVESTVVPRERERLVAARDGPRFGGTSACVAPRKKTPRPVAAIIHH
jgi:hypothetical protein